MKALLRSAGIALALIAVLIGVAIFVAPPLHRALEAAGIARTDRFDRTVRFVILVPFLLIFFAWKKPWRDGGPMTYGAPRIRTLVLGYGSALGVLLFVLSIQFAAGWLVFEDPLDGPKAARRVVKFFLSGWLTALLEEWFFRGWLDRRLRRHLAPLGAAVAVAGLYAVLHVFTLRDGATPAPPTVDGALHVLALWAGRLFNPAYALPKILGLFLFSLLLTALYRRSRTLSTAVAVHAACIFVLYAYGALTDRVVDPTFWTGTKRLYDGPLAWVALVVLLALVLRPRPATSDGGRRMTA